MNIRESLGMLLVIPASVLMAVVIGGGLYAIMLYGGWVLTTLHYFLSRTMGLPKPVSLSLAVLSTALIVYATVPRVMSWIGDKLNRWM